MNAVDSSALLHRADQSTVVVMTGPQAAQVAHGLRHDVTDVTAEVFAAAPWCESPARARRLTSRMLAEAGRPGFVFAFAFTGQGTGLAGFGYGLPRRPGPGAAESGLDFAGTEPFEFCRLAVRPADRGQGTGRALHDAVAGASGPGPRWLVTHPAAQAAVGLCRANGWQAGRLLSSRASGVRLLLTRNY